MTTESDRELLELAAKAAGIVVVRSRLDDPACADMLVERSVRNPVQALGPWNPLTDDGDALRLSVKLGLMLKSYAPDVRFHGFVNVVGYGTTDDFHDIYEDHNGDEYAATRRAITRAAASIGRGEG